MFRLSTLLAIGVLLSPAFALSQPAIIPLSDVDMQIVRIQFVDEVVTPSGQTLTAPDPTYKVALVTVRVNKPADMGLTIHAADLVLRYEHDNGYDVSPCEGMSGFSLRVDDARPMDMPAIPGPDWLRQTTGVPALAAEEIYFDAVFAQVEVSTTAVWLSVSQPTTTVPYEPRGEDFNML
jgi:hypothetical protein